MGRSFELPAVHALEPEPEPEPEPQQPQGPRRGELPGPVEPSTPARTGTHPEPALRYQAVKDAWSPALPLHAPSHHLGGGSFRDGTERKSFWLWLAWRLRDASVVVADEVVPASEISSNTELVMIELNDDVIDTEAVHAIAQRAEQWRTVEVSTSLEDNHSVIVQVDSAGCGNENALFSPEPFSTFKMIALPRQALGTNMGKTRRVYLQAGLAEACR